MSRSAHAATRLLAAACDVLTARNPTEIRVAKNWFAEFRDREQD